MRKSVKLSLHTTAVASELNQLKVWINRMSIAMEAECPPDKVSLNVYVSADVDLTNLPPTYCDLNVTIIGGKDKEPHSKESLKMAALANAIAPWAEAAAILELNVLAVQSIRPILYHLMDSGIPHIGSVVGDIPFDEVSADKVDEYFRQKVLSPNYYTDDIVMFKVDEASRQLAKVKAFDLAKRYQLIQKAAGSPVCDFQNRVMPTLETWKPDELYRVNPLAKLSGDLADIHAARQVAHTTPYLIAFDKEVLPWDPELVTNMNMAVRQPYMRYAMAVYNTAEYLDPDFVLTVFRKANSFTQYDPLTDVRNLPTPIRDVLDADKPSITAEDMYALVMQLKGKS